MTIQLSILVNARDFIHEILKIFVRNLQPKIFKNGKTMNIGVPSTRFSLKTYYRKKAALLFFKTKLSLKEKAKGHLTSCWCENGAGGLGTSISIPFRSFPTRSSLV